MTLLEKDGRLTRTIDQRFRLNSEDLSEPTERNDLRSRMTPLAELLGHEGILPSATDVGGIPAFANTQLASLHNKTPKCAVYLAVLSRYRS